MDTKQKILFTSLSENELSRLMEASVRKALETDKRPPEQDVLLTTRQASALICYKPSTIYGLAKENKIPHVKARGKLLFSRNALLEWIASANLNYSTPLNSNQSKEATA
ncbi:MULTISPECIES: helix-turn-helix domain-containing protein [Sphingobacterium]|uniref:helix-turn-helix domain-containing protein n=1 Tax=Sphingobacterium TaxID=28453 RepID=UPI00257B29B7|nr:MULTISPECIES: helix-turn-helix domain-containing protein [Sphingobacterium]